MDGTLLDSSYALTCSVNHVRSTLGLEPVSTEFLEYYINEPDQNLAMIFYETQEYNLEHKELFKEHYLKTTSLHVKPYEGVYEFLEFLYKKGFTLSIATNASDFFAINMLKEQNMFDFFTFIIGANNVEKSKPNPDMIDLLIQKTEIPKDETLFIGDSIKDELASFNANVDFAFVKWGYGKAKEAKNQFNDFNELLEHINNNGY